MIVHLLSKGSHNSRNADIMNKESKHSQPSTTVYSNELQDDPNPPCKRPAYVYSSNETKSPKRVMQVNEQQERRKEARRASNRMSQKAFRLKQKRIVQDLEEVNASLQVDNMNLRNRLERTLLENEEMRSLMEREQRVAMEQSQVLRQYLENLIERDKLQMSSRGLYFPRVTPPLTPAGIYDVRSLPSHYLFSSNSSFIQGLQGCNRKYNESMLPPYSSALQYFRFGNNVSTYDQYLEIMRRHREFNAANAQDSIHSQMLARWLDETLCQANESMPLSGFSSHTQQQHTLASAAEADEVRALEQELKELKRKVAQL
jgi:regulator of replication initiation timing